MLREGGELRDLVDRALAGDQASARALVERLFPVVRRRVAAVLCRKLSRRDIQQEIMDMTQSVFVALFDANGKALRAWDPERGSTLEGFVGLLARHHVLSVLRRGRTSPWPDEPTDDEQLDVLARTTLVADEIVGSREHLHLLLDRIREELSPLGQELFQRIIVDDEPLEQLAIKFNRTIPALYQWRSRLLRRLRSLSAEILDSSGSVASDDRRKKKRSSHL